MKCPHCQAEFETEAERRLEQRRAADRERLRAYRARQKDGNVSGNVTKTTAQRPKRAGNVTKANGTRFVPPTMKEVRAYCEERQNAVDPVKWWNHYQSNGWHVGRNKMKDWRAAVHTWERS